MAQVQENACFGEKLVGEKMVKINVSVWNQDPFVKANFYSCIYKTCIKYRRHSYGFSFSSKGNAVS